MSTLDSGAIREALRYALIFQDSTVFIAPSPVGPFENEDLEALLRDVSLLTQLGMNIVVVEYRNAPFWREVERAENVRVVELDDERDLVNATRVHGVKKICFVTGVDRLSTNAGVLDDVTLEMAQVLLNEPDSGDEQTRQAIALAVSACKSGVNRTHFFSVRSHGDLLRELFTGSGAGTMIYAGQVHKEVRAALWSDRVDICDLSNFLRESVRRHTIAYVREHLEELRVFTVDGDIHGATRLTVHEQELWVRTLVHADRFNAAEVLQRLLVAALDEAKAKSLERVIVSVSEIPALMRIQPWFSKLGFTKQKASAGDGLTDAWVKQMT